jgi:molybdopterin synthase catalytic subunit
MLLTTDPLDVGALLADVDPSEGAICLFVGVVRGENDGRRTVAIEYEAYGAMAESQLARIAREVAEKSPPARVRIRHRVGRVPVGEASVAVVATAPHRANAFEACRAAMERIKKDVPIWKKEFHSDGSGEWVDPTKGVR